jgi:hypothetical protein
MSHHALLNVAKPESVGGALASLSERRKQNSLTLICRLPHELLVAIIRDVQIQRDQSHDNRAKIELESEFFDFDSYNTLWFRITWICIHIRNVALNSPELWTRVVSKQTKQWNALMLSRAEASGLCINVCDGPDIETLLENISRATYARMVSYRHSDSQTQNAVESLRDAPATMLSILHT